MEFENVKSLLISSYTIAFENLWVGILHGIEFLLVKEDLSGRSGIMRRFCKRKIS